MKGIYEYKAISHLDMLGRHHKLINTLNTVAILMIMLFCAAGAALNYCLRMWGLPGGYYFLYILGGVAGCVLYIYLHELTHAIAILMITGVRPEIKFGRLAASCGAPTTSFTKAGYFFVASFPFFFYCAALIPLCILLPAEFFPLPFMPLCYNVFGSMGDMYMISKMMRVRKGSVIVDSGTSVSAYAPISE